MVIFNGGFTFNWGDLLILIATTFFPLGNIYAKRALKFVSPVMLVFVRSVIGGLVLLFLSLFLEDWHQDLTKVEGLFRSFWWLFLLNGLLVSGVSKILWYQGLRRLDMSKATILVMTYPAFGVIFATTFLHEIPTAYQLFGLLIVFFGVFTVTRVKKAKEVITEIG